MVAPQDGQTLIGIEQALTLLLDSSIELMYPTVGDHSPGSAAQNRQPEASEDPRSHVATRERCESPSPPIEGRITILIENSRHIVSYGLPVPRMRAVYIPLRFLTPAQVSGGLIDSSLNLPVQGDTTGGVSAESVFSA